MQENQIYSSRKIQFPISKVWDAYSTEALIKEWWGPHGFTNEFEIFEFKPEGKWIFTMISADGVRFPNTIVFKEIIPLEKIYLEHLPAPYFYAEILFTPVWESTKLEFSMIFNDVATYEAANKYAPEKNEENFDRLEAVLEKIHS